MMSGDSLSPAPQPMEIDEKTIPIYIRELEAHLFSLFTSGGCYSVKMPSKSEKV